MKVHRFKFFRTKYSTKVGFRDVPVARMTSPRPFRYADQNPKVPKLKFQPNVIDQPPQGVPYQLQQGLQWDQILRFIVIFVKVSKSIIFLLKSLLGNFYRHLAIISGHTEGICTHILCANYDYSVERWICHSIYIASTIYLVIEWLHWAITARSKVGWTSEYRLASASDVKTTSLWYLNMALHHSMSSEAMMKRTSEFWVVCFRLMEAIAAV